MTSIVWMRNDLRIDDNKALYHACKYKKNNIIILFIYIYKDQKYFSISHYQKNFIKKRLLYLKKKFYTLNIKFLYKKLNSFNESIKYILSICKKYSIKYFFYNIQYELNQLNRDLILSKKLIKNNIKVLNFHDNCLISPNIIKNNSGHTYKTFYFFKKKSLKYLKKNKIVCFSKPKIRIKNNIILNNKKIKFNYKNKFFNEKRFPFKDKLIKEKIIYFFKKKIVSYFKNKDFLYLNNTSECSVYLNLGVISIRRFFYYILKYRKNNYKSSFILLEKLLWRDFFKNLIVSYPNLSENFSFKLFKKKMKYKKNMFYFKSWKKGLTGFPIIDAGMRQLKKTGWMNNRIRMITSSFLVKNLLIDWRIGERYFMLYLIDSDISINNGNWKWISSIKIDSVSYIRMFNPYIQSKKFDFNGIFIKKYVKELKNVPIKNIHKPYLWLKKNEPNTKYPKPIVDYFQTKIKFIKKIKKINKKKYEEYIFRKNNK
ncbi:MAG: deoxyribodipyrimidine photo-lyase [Buchnera aphidicola (Periphyllus acericola)]|uniref:deoxyribodipyrimidine photo-lyase n=1 Tax=Buchnera aphidicola TaxID=9 RepID=UPI0030D15D22|nr:deoxyribodipyrimidine photo-lyase [Buchnera aphidicola (Periphyllus acericola)]